jgi:hypothetical protein
MARGQTAPDIAAADHHGSLNTEIFHLFDALGDLRTICGEMFSRAPLESASRLI